MGLRLILVVAREDLRQLYQKHVRALGVQCDAVGSFGELWQRLQETAYNGLLIDLPTSIKAVKTDKYLGQELIPLYPTLSVKWDAENQQIHCLQLGNLKMAGISLESFIAYHCRPFRARKIRKEKRFKLHFNVLLSTSDDFPNARSERSSSLDISQNGSSLLTSRDWHLSQRVWLRILELQDQTPIEAEIRRWTPWGKPQALPSIGVSFVSLQPSQREQLQDPQQLISD